MTMAVQYPVREKRQHQPTRRARQCVVRCFQSGRVDCTYPPFFQPTASSDATIPNKSRQPPKRALPNSIIPINHTPHTQAADGRHASGFTGSPLRGPLSSQPGGPASYSSSPSSPPALTISIPSPVAEKGAPPSRRTPTTGRSADGGGRTTALLASRTPNQDLAAAGQRYKSLFTNAPAELPAVTVVPAGGGGGRGDDNGDGNPPEGGASAHHRPTTTTTTTWATETGSSNNNNNNDHHQGARGSASPNMNQPAIRRRAQTAKIDYHNSVRRRSSNTTFTHPVGHPSGLDTLVQSQQKQQQPRPVESLEGWGDGQTGLAPGGGSGRTSANKAGGKVSVVASAEGAGAGTEQEEPFRWIPGGAGQANRTPVVHSHRNNKRGGVLSPAAAKLAPSASADETAAGSATRLSQPKRMAAAASSSRPRGGNTVGWVGAVLDEPRGHSSSAASFSPPPSAASSYAELPRQLAVPGSLLVGEEGSTGIVGGIFGGADGGAGTAAGHSRLQHANRGFGGVGGRQQRGMGGRGGGGRGGRGPAEANNLHPAWRPKGLTRRQRAVSMVQRG